jgi:hypothetical protein
VSTDNFVIVYEWSYERIKLVRFELAYFGDAHLAHCVQDGSQDVYVTITKHLLLKGLLA